jgi:ligand-binding SRPBCC domain-containing protein
VVKVVKSTIMDAPIEAVWEVLRDFNGHDRWHPVVADSQIERGLPSDKIGCVRRFHLKDGSELREQLLTLSDADMSFSYCLLDTPVPLLNYVAHVRLFPVTDGDRTFWQWDARFDTPAGREEELATMVGRDIYEGGFAAIRKTLGLAPTQAGGA